MYCEYMAHDRYVHKNFVNKINVNYGTIMVVHNHYSPAIITPRACMR
jgi:hypothetical protein